MSYLELFGLRSQHVFSNEKRGQTKFSLNTSKRVVDLYDALESENIDNIDDEVEDAYNNPYFSSSDISQTIVVEDWLFELKAHDFFVAEVNNPVFPEIELFNVRTDTLSVQKSINYKNWRTFLKLSYLNRWFLEERYSLEEIVTDNMDLELKYSKTYTPLYFDFKSQLIVDDFSLILNGEGFDIFNNDKYNYYILQTRMALEVLNHFSVFFDLPVTYIGNYEVMDDTGLGIKYKIYEVFEGKVRISKMKNELMLSALANNTILELQVFRIRKSSIEDKFINNISFNIGMKY